MAEPTHVGVAKGILVKGLTSSDPDYLKVLDPGGTLRPAGSARFIPTHLFESIEPLTEEETDG